MRGRRHCDWKTDRTVTLCEGADMVRRSPRERQRLAGGEALAAGAMVVEMGCGGG